MNFVYNKLPDGAISWTVSGSKRDFENNIGWKERFAMAGYKVRIVSVECLTGRVYMLDPWNTVTYKVITAPKGDKARVQRGPKGVVESKKLVKYPLYKIMKGKFVQVSTKGNPVEETALDRKRRIALRKAIWRCK